MTITIKNGDTMAAIEAAKKTLLPKDKRPSTSNFYGKLKGVFGDGLDYQKKIRDENFRLMRVAQLVPLC